MKTKTKIIMQAFACFLCGFLAGMDFIQGYYLIMATRLLMCGLFFSNIGDYINEMASPSPTKK